MEDIMEVVEVVRTPTYSTINYLLEAAGIHHVMNNEEACEFGLQLGLEDNGNIIGGAELVLGEGGAEDIMEWRE